MRAQEIGGVRLSEELHGNCMELLAVGWCTMKWLRFDQTIRNLTSGDSEIPIVVTQLGITRFKKTRSCIS